MNTNLQTAFRADAAVQTAMSDLFVPTLVCLALCLLLVLHFALGSEN